MSEPNDRVLTWMQQGTVLFLDRVSALDDSEFDAATRLPGWSRRHLVAHVGFNARALQRLVAWARTGERNPMYSSPEQRATEIEEGAGWDVTRLRQLVTTSAADLAADLHGLEASQWRAEVVTAQGRTVTAREIPWMRTREVAIHAVDLGNGATFSDLPRDLNEAIVDDVVTRRTGLHKDPAVELRCTTGRTWTIQGYGSPVVVEGTPDQLAQWLTGRGTEGLGEEVAAPALTPWL